MTEQPSQTHAHSRNPNISAFHIVPHTVLSLGYSIQDFRTGTWMALKQCIKLLVLVHVLKHMSLDPELGFVGRRALKAPGATYSKSTINNSHAEGRVDHWRPSGTIGATGSGSFFYSAGSGVTAIANCRGKSKAVRKALSKDYGVKQKNGS